ncbi:hypothetical protein Tco_1332042, partial [Tanacetum coccineum]
GPSLPPHPEANKKLKILSKRKVASSVPGKALPLKVQKVPAQASKVAEFPSAKELMDATDSHWVVAHVTPPSWKHLREISIEQLCDIHDMAYMRLAVLNNVLNNKNPLVSDMRAEIKVLQGQVDGLHSIESEKERLKSSEIQLLQEIDSLKQDRAVVVSKVISDATMKLVRSNDLEVAAMKEPFVLEKMLSYRPSSKEEYDQAGDALANASYPFLAEYVVNLYASLDQLLSKKPPSL